MLTLVGLGLCDGHDITLRGKEAVARAQHVYLEGYTSVLQCTHEQLEAQLGSKIALLNRHDIELHADRILTQARTSDVAVLVIGDVFGATTHADLYLRATKAGISVRVVHNASVLNAVGAVGLELYKYGRTVSVPYWSKGFEPTSFLEYLKENFDRGLHTLCLLDIKSDEGRYMNVKEGIEHLERAEAVRKTGITKGLLAIGVARIGCPDQRIKAGTLAQLKAIDFGKPPHAIIIPGSLHPVEEEMLELWK